MVEHVFMERKIETELLYWKRSPFRKPLILKGARQVGKTQALKEFGARHYRNVAYVSLEKVSATTPSEYAQFFEQTLDPFRIIANLSLALGTPIEPQETLLILDEIQDCPAAINSLKYFCEDAPQMHVACAGSLLGVALASEGSFPVGKVGFLTLYPMSFGEFLLAVGQGQLADYAEKLEELTPIPDIFSNRLTDYLKAYFMVGGMPEAVLRWKLTGDIAQVDEVLANLLDSYERDFAKHGGGRMYPKLVQIWDSLPTQLARENKKFTYGLVKEGARAREYEDAVTWLEGAGLVYRVKRSSRPGIPMSAYDDNAFKLYLLDVGLLRRLARLDATAFARPDGLFTEFKGAFAESYALQALVPQLDAMPRYWAVDNPRYEVDFLLQVNNWVLPCEVKAGASVAGTSLKNYGKRYPDATPLKLRLSLKNLKFDGGLLNVPLYLGDQVARLAREGLGKA